MDSATDFLPEVLQPYSAFIINIALALVIFVVGWIVSKWANRICLKVARRANIDEALARFLGGFLQYAILALTVVTVLSKVGVPTTSFVALIGAAGLAIGMALQGNLGNFASGIMILLFRPFTFEDKVTIAGETGQVREIGLFATEMNTPSNDRIIVPNGEVTSNVITNHTSRGQIRGGIALGISYGSDVEQAMQVMVDACKRVGTVLADPAPSVYFKGFGASSLDFEVRPWATSDDYLGMLHNVRIALYNDLNAAQVEIPFDQLVVHKAESA